VKVDFAVIVRPVFALGRRTVDGSSWVVDRIRLYGELKDSSCYCDNRGWKRVKEERNNFCSFKTKKTPSGV
jgi:hypothetical protein